MEQLRRTLRDRWALDVVSTAVTSTADGTSVLRVATNTAEVAVKIHDESRLDAISQGARIQQFAFDNHLPVPQLLPTTDGDLVVHEPPAAIVVEVWCRADPMAFDPPSFEALGTAAARLHSLDPAELPLAPPFDLDGVLGDVESLLVAIDRAAISWIRELMVDAVESVAPLTRGHTVVHGDLAPGNVLLIQPRQALLIDFEQAGVGPPVLDLAEVTTHLTDGPSGSGRLVTPLAVAFMTGYRSVRTFTNDDVDGLVAAHLVHQLRGLRVALLAGDQGFLQRMRRRIDTWRSGLLDQLEALMA